MKRLFDLLFASIGLVLSAPFLLGCMAIIKLTSRGPAIFRQTRVGIHETPFICFKLRTMHVSTGDAPSHEVSASAVTGIGKWLRALKLDELPQLLNIIKGEMSFIGPRPCLPSQRSLIAARRTRGLYTIRPGISGVSQIAGVDMSDPEKLSRLDATYLENMSLRTDLGMIWRTFIGAGRGDRVAAVAKSDSTRRS